jgi:hypothetical protein
MAEALGTVHTCRRGLLWGWWWPVGPKLVWPDVSTSPGNYEYHHVFVFSSAPLNVMFLMWHIHIVLTMVRTYILYFCLKYSLLIFWNLVVK